MKYNFDNIVCRKYSDAVKIESCIDVFGTSDVQPMWVADMDFKTPNFIFNAIKDRCKHPILGYTVLPKEFKDIACRWQKNLHQWNVDKDWVGFLSGIVPGLSFAVQAYTNVGDEIIIQPPVYPPFLTAVQKNNRNLVYNPLKIVNNRYEMDFEDLENKITNKTKMLILCNPHNPGGIVWGTETLSNLASICKKHNVIVVSDEIHADMTFKQYKHVPFAKVSEVAQNNCITFVSPSKTFNIPGLLTSIFIIPNKELKDIFFNFLNRNEILSGNIFAYIATMSAYKDGNEWRLQMLEYVRKNIDFAIKFFKENIPQVKPMNPEASFLIWLDCKDLGFSPEDLPKFFIKKAKLGLSDGRIFGPGGEYRMRLNVACPKKELKKALINLFESLKIPQRGTSKKNNSNIILL